MRDEAETFTGPFMYWVGMNMAPDTDAEALAEFNHFYSAVHQHEVVAANPGFIRATRFELLQPDPRGDFGPRWLAAYEMDAEQGAQTYIARNDGPPSGRPTYTPTPPAWKRTQTKWRMIWRHIASCGTASEAPHAIFMVGMNVPPGTDAAGLAEFNAFYTQTHVPEVMANGGYTRGTRWELYHEFLHPEPGCPRFCAIYEGDKAATDARAAGRSSGKLSSGPPTWEAHDTLWRLVYRRLEPEEPAR